MNELIVACVRTGDRLPFDLVTRRRNAVARHLKLPYTMVCLTDQPERCSGVGFVDVTALDLKGAWAKMALFEPQWRGLAKVIYFDLDIQIVGDISVLADVPGEFAWRRPDIMVIGGGKSAFVWRSFEKSRELWMERGSSVGECISALYPHAPMLMLPRETCSRMEKS